jgi:dephospho-CoA kinase
MIILGLTGSIAMGKSVAASLFRKNHIPVWDADVAVHELLANKGKAVAKVAKFFPDAYQGGAIDRSILASKVFHDKQLLTKLEQIIHPLTRQSEQDFIHRSRKRKEKIIVVDIPLLFELHKEHEYDAVIVVTASKLVQEKRALKRSGMTKERLRFILGKQLPDHKKRAKANYIITSGLGKAVTNRQIQALLQRMKLCVK